MKYVAVIKALSKHYGYSLREALGIFYQSKVYQDMSDSSSNMFCLSPKYLAADIDADFRR
jgi:hypothetical protein